MEIIRITKYSGQAYNAVVQLLPQLSPETELPTKKFFRTFLSSEHTHFFIARLDNNEIAGMFTIVVYNIPTGLKLWIEDVVIDKSQRGKGLGKELIQFAIDYSKSIGAKEVRLTSRPSRVEANQLYLRMGFTRYETNVYKYNLKV